MCDFRFGSDVWRGLVADEEGLPRRRVAESREKIKEYTASERRWLLKWRVSEAYVRIRFNQSTGREGMKSAYI